MTTPSPSLPPELLATLPEAVRAYIRYPRSPSRRPRSPARPRLRRTRPSRRRPTRRTPSRPRGKPPTGKAQGRAARPPPAEPHPTCPRTPSSISGPRTCGRCARPLAGGDPDPLRHQVVELPPVRPHVTEYRRHRLACPRCGRVTCPALPADARGGYGPRVQAACAVLGRGVPGRQAGRRPAAAATCSGCRSARPPCATSSARRPPPWTRSPPRPTPTSPGSRRTWTRPGGGRAASGAGCGSAVTAGVTVFLVRLSRGRKVLADLIPGPAGVLTTDRYPAYDHLPAAGRQVCWAHLRRDFQAMIDRTERRVGGRGGLAGPRRHPACGSGSGCGTGR